MYNEIQKLEYIEYESVNTAPLTNYFKRVEPYEEMLGKDICEMSAPELKNVLNSLGIISTISKRNIISMFRAYIDWCISQGRTHMSENKLKQIDDKDVTNLSSIKSKMIKDPEHLNEIIADGIHREYDERQIKTKRYELIARLLYAGIEKTELPNLKKYDINHENTTVLGCTIDERTKDIWQEVSEANELEFGLEFYKKLVDNDYLFRTFETAKGGNEKVSTVYFNNVVRKITELYSEHTTSYLKLSPNTIRKSGLFYKLLSTNQTFEDIAELFRFDTSRADYETKGMQRVRGYMDDFENWKIAFGYE